jgi:hypothetical protein
VLRVTCRHSANPMPWYSSRRPRRVARSGYLPVSRTQKTYIAVDPTPIHCASSGGARKNKKLEYDPTRALVRDLHPRPNSSYRKKSPSPLPLGEPGASEEKTDSNCPGGWSGPSPGRIWLSGGVGGSSPGTWVAVRDDCRTLDSCRERPCEDCSRETDGGPPMKTTVILILALIFALSPTLGCSSNPAPAPGPAPIPATGEPEHSWSSSSTPWIAGGVLFVVLTTLALAPLKQCPRCEGERRMVSVGMGAAPITPGEYDLTKSGPEDYSWVDCTGCNGRGRTSVLRAWLGNRGNTSRKKPIVRQS